jgi:peptidoglycan hydrolase CwlO-like protein
MVLGYGMDRDKLEKALERAEERIALGKKQIADQKEIIAKLERAGQVTVEAKGLLAVFEGTQEINFTVRDILRRQRHRALH